jgi:hypothetical protein
MLVEDDYPGKVDFVVLEDSDMPRLFEVRVEATGRLLYTKIPTMAQ